MALLTAALPGWAEAQQTKGDAANEAPPEGTTSQDDERQTPPSDAATPPEGERPTESEQPAESAGDAPLLGPAPATESPEQPEATGAAGVEPASADGRARSEAVEEEEARTERPAARDLAEPPPSEIYAEDWWTLSRPVFELHGYYRVRAEFFHNFHLGRVESARPLWPRPADDSFIDLQGVARDVALCGDSGNPADFENCTSNTQAGANMRLRLNPELHISDNLRVRTQIDLLDNIVLGSTPNGYANQPGSNGGYEVVARGGYQPLGAFSYTQWAPLAGVNSTKDSIMVKRAWGEYSSPIGQLRFGRMPSHWGLGMLVNSGDGYDSDWQSTADRIMFITGYAPWDLYGAFAWDFANEGPTSAVFQELEGQPYDLAQGDDVTQLVFLVMRRRNEQLARRDLAAGKPVIEGGGYFVYRHQKLANDTTAAASGASLGQDPINLRNGYVRRGAEAFIPDLWFRFRWKKFRFEAEAAVIAGTLENTQRDSNDFVNSAEPDDDGWRLLQFGLATQSELRVLEDRLRIGFDFGYATGDDDVENIAPLGNELQPQLTLNRNFSTFRFHPDYRVDLILFRNILSRVQGAYYFKPSVGYEFLRDPDGQKIGGDASLIWSRASQPIQAPGNAPDLGLEINLRLFYQAKDGVLNDDLERMGGFFTSLEYGVLFPLAGLGYLPGQVSSYAAFQSPGDEELDTATAQVVRWYLGILF